MPDSVCKRIARVPSLSTVFLPLFLAMLVFGGYASRAASTAQTQNPTQNQTPSTWSVGPFVNSGVGTGNRSSFYFLSLGVQGGRILTPVIHAGPLSGQFEYGVNVMPFWQSYTPAAGLQTVNVRSVSYQALFGGGTFTGASITPAIFRWNFKRSSSQVAARHWQPWVQAAGGLIYTTHKYPPDQLVAKGTPGGTSVWNFSPQGGGGVHFFLRPRRSIDLGVNAVHISSASLGDRNPGVNASIQVQVGYSWWK